MFLISGEVTRNVVDLSVYLLRMALECLGGSVHFGVALEVNWVSTKHSV